MSTAPDIRPTWADIDTAAYSRNIDAIRRRLPPGCGLIAVLKADAYGHGAVELAKQCTPDRVAMIAVALLEEALELRASGVTLPLLVLGPLTERQIAECIAHDVTPGVVGPEELEEVARAGQPIAIHLKLDSGMGRMGVIDRDLPRVIDILKSASFIRVDAVYTHFADAGGNNDAYTTEQIAHFDRMVAELAAAGIKPPKRHLANSAATMRGIGIADYVRVGLALFGAEALDVGTSKLEPVMRWRTEIARLKTLPAGSGVGYGVTYRTPGERRIATLPVGYADGYSRLHSNNGEVMIRGVRAPVVGRVSMDLITVDVTGVPSASVGDECVLLGEGITAEELARRTNTISYEVFCRVSKRVPRFYR